MSPLTRVVLAAAGMVGALSFGAGGQVPGSASPLTKPPPRLAIYVPTPRDVVLRMLELAGVTKRDVVYDLGCGDGRIAITAAARFGARAVGVDIDRSLILQSQENARAAGVEKLVTFRVQDALDVDVSPATVVTLYLGESSNVRLRPILTRELRAGARIVSHQFSMGDWAPLKVEQFRSEAGYSRMIYLWKADGVVRE
ncbi:MAG: methyltransferase domain-containing protein [Acidobacteria bacterium]|nr:methyltransferase domain-containing protein [Acidobacteriota bacterium]